MTRRRIRRAYRTATKEYERGLLEGLAGNDPWPSEAVGVEGVARYHGRLNGKAFKPGPYGGVPTKALPPYVWAEVLAEALRP